MFFADPPVVVYMNAVLIHERMVRGRLLQASQPSRSDREVLQSLVEFS